MEEGAKESGRTPAAALPCGSRSPAGSWGRGNGRAGLGRGLAGAGPAQFGRGKSFPFFYKTFSQTNKNKLNKNII